MGMTGNILRVNESQLNAFLNDSSLLEKKIHNDETPNENMEQLDLDKSWAGILYLLTGNGIDDLGHPLAAVLFSGQFIDEDQDLGYGPAQYLFPAQVSNLNQQISVISKADLKRRFDPGEMAEMEIYPLIWDEGDETFDYLYHYFVSLQLIFAEAAKNKEAIITYIS